MDEGRRLHERQFSQTTGSLIRAASILVLSGGATLGLLYASFWANSGRLENSRNPSFAQELQDWRQDSAAFLVRSEPNPELNPRSVAYTAIAIAGLGTGLLVFGLLERANHRLRVAQEECDRNWQAYQQTLEEKEQVENYATTLSTRYNQLAQAQTEKQIEFQATKESLRQQRDQALEELEQVTQQRDQALAEKAEVEARIQQLESSIQQITQQYQQAVDEKAKFAAEIQQLKTEKRRWIDYVERSQTDDYEALNYQYETLEQQFDQLQANYQQLQSTHQQLQYKVNAQEMQIQAQYEQYERAQEGNTAATAGSSETAIVLHSTERDLYDHEKRDLVLEILERYSPNLLENSRRQHILQDILDTNQPAKRRDEIAVELRHLFWDYRSMKTEIRNSLSALGFELIEDGTHYKIIFQQDSRYQITFSKTSSDRRAGRNIVSEIRRRLL